MAFNVHHLTLKLGSYAFHIQAWAPNAILPGAWDPSPPSKPYALVRLTTQQNS